MSQVWVVVRREYLERVRTKGFVIATLAVPLIMMGLMAFSIFMGVRSQQSEREMALVDYTGALGASVAADLDQAGWEIEVAEPSAGAAAELERRLEDDEIQAYLILDDVTAAEGAFVYRSKDGPGRVFRAISERVVAEAALSARLAGMEDPAGLRQLLGGGELEFQALRDEDDGEGVDEGVSLVVGFAGAFLLYITMLIYGAYVLRSVLDEKTNRVVEVVISSIRPWQLMLGKILGVGAMGLTQLGIWVAFVAVLALAGLPLAAARLPIENVDLLQAVLPGVGVLLLFLVYFVLGYFLYAALFAAVGAMCSREEEAQQAQFPLVMLLIVPLMLQMNTINGRGFEWIEWVALFPFFSPILMFPRAAAGTVPAWMTALSLLLMAAAIAGTAWVAGRIYRTGILMQGKRPTLKELVRWIRAS